MPAENGFVPTPPPLADFAAAVAFGAERPSEVDGARVLLPGLGTGNLYAGVRRYCSAGENWYIPRFDYPMPECVAVENDPARIREFQERHPEASVEIHEADFLLDPPSGPFDWVLTNPPFTRYAGIPSEKRDLYRAQSRLADGQFPLYVPFVEQALDLLKDHGWLTVILPIGALTTWGLTNFRNELRSHFLGDIYLIPSPTFNRTVETVLVTLQKRSRSRPNTSLWLHSIFVYTCRLHDYLERIGVDDVNAASTAYTDQIESFQSRLRYIDRREYPEAYPHSDTESAPDRQASMNEYG